MNEIKDRHALAVVGELGQVGVDVRIEIDAARFGLQHHGEGGELLRDAGDVESRCAGDRDAMLQVGAAEIALEHRLAAHGHQGGEAGLVLGERRQQLVEAPGGAVSCHHRLHEDILMASRTSGAVQTIKQGTVWQATASVRAGTALGRSSPLMRAAKVDVEGAESYPFFRNTASKLHAPPPAKIR